MVEKSERPGIIERQFRHELGAINPYLCLVDSAVEFFLEETEAKSDKAKFLRIIAGKYGHHHLYTEHLCINDLRKFVYLAHIALINSKAEAACKRIQKIKMMLKESKNSLTGDCLRKTITIVYFSKEGHHELEKKVEDKIAEDYVGKTEFRVIDYFRLIRNNEFHPSKKDENLNNILKIYNSIDQDFLRKVYQSKLNKPEEINSKDVLLLSKVWQKSIKEICRKCLNMEKVYEELKLQHKGISKEERRKNKIIQSLKQDFLQTDEDISIIMGTQI